MNSWDYLYTVLGWLGSAHPTAPVWLDTQNLLLFMVTDLIAPPSRGCSCVYFDVYLIIFKTV